MYITIDLSSQNGMNSVGYLNHLFVFRIFALRITQVNPTNPSVISDSTV